MNKLRLYSVSIYRKVHKQISQEEKGQNLVLARYRRTYVLNKTQVQ